MTKINKIIALIGISLLSFTGFLDVTIVSTALPDMQSGLHMSVTQLQWVMNACFLGVSAFMASMGRVADMYGRRKVFYIGVIIFGLASLGAGLAAHPFILILCRAIQGITIAITIPVAIGLIQTVFEQHEIAKAMGVFGTITGSGLALGPVAGGALVTHFGWPSVFLVNIPFVILGFALCLFTVNESRSTSKMRLDYFGILFLVLTIGSLVFAVVEANNFGWDSPVIIASFIIFALSLILFVITESNVTDPIMAPALFKNHVFIPAMLFSFIGGALMGVILFINPLYLNLILNKSIWMTGVYLFIIPVAVMLSSPFIGHINHKVGPRKIMLYGSLFYLLAALGHLFFSVSTNNVLLIATFTLFGLGWAIVNQVPAVALGQAIDTDHVGVAMGALFSFFNIGAAVVLAVSVALFHFFALHDLIHHLGTLNANQLNLIHQFVNQPEQLQAVLAKLNMSHNALIFKNAFMSGLHAMYIPLIAFAVIALLAVKYVMR